MDWPGRVVSNSVGAAAAAAAGATPLVRLPSHLVSGPAEAAAAGGHTAADVVATVVRSTADVGEWWRGL